MTTILDDVTHWERLDDTTFEGELSERWANGPGAYGGVVAATLLHQMRRVLDDEKKQPRTFQMHMCAPLHFEPARLRVRLDRRGMTVSHVSARIEQAGDVAAVASATLGGTREGSPRLQRLEMPEAPPPEELELSGVPALLPRFANEFFEFRHCLGAFPMSGADEPETGGWLSTEEPMTDGPLLAACLLDAWPPSIFTTFETFRRTVTIDLRYEFGDVHDRSGETTEPFLFHAVTDVASEGYAREDAELWSEEGDLVARAQQTYGVLD